MMEQKTVFRRINGRIVPIRSSGEMSRRDKRKIAEGTGIAAAGVAIAGTSGKAYQKTMFNSIKKSSDAFRNLESMFKGRPTSGVQKSFFDLAAEEASKKKAYDDLAKAARASKNAARFRSASIPIGAALIGYGALRAYSGLSSEDQRRISPEMAAGGGAALGVLIPKARELSKDAFEAGIGGKQGSFGFVKNKFHSVSPILKKILKAKF